jgi:hypothetical protein
MGPFNGDAETPDGWLYWTSGGDTGFANTVLDTGAHSGNYSAMLQELDDNGDEMVFYSEPVAAQPDKWYAIGVWIKADGVNTDTLAYTTNAIPDFDENRLGFNFFFHRTPLDKAWDLTGGDQFCYVDQRNPQSGWTHYVICAKAPADAGGVSMRARFNPYPTGTVYYDDFSINELPDVPNLLTNGDLETWAPNFWSPLNGTQGTVTWATDETAPTTDANANLRSFKIEKTAVTTDAVGWQSENNADLYWNNAAGNVLYSFSFMAKTMGVNTSPANNDEAIGLWYQFYVGGGLIGEQFVAVDQSTASVDWAEYTGQLLVTSEPDEVIMTLQMGKNATGTVWFDNIGCGTDPWSMGPFNGDAETPDGWLYWTSGGDTGFANTVLDTGAHSGG